MLDGLFYLVLPPSPYWPARRRHSRASPRARISSTRSRPTSRSAPKSATAAIAWPATTGCRPRWATPNRLAPAGHRASRVPVAAAGDRSGRRWQLSEHHARPAAFDRARRRHGDLGRRRPGRAPWRPHPAIPMPRTTRGRRLRAIVRRKARCPSRNLRCAAPARARSRISPRRSRSSNLAANNLTYGEARYWQVTIVVTSNTPRTLSTQVQCTFLNGGRPVGDAYFGPTDIAAGEQISTELIGPPTTVFVDFDQLQGVEPIGPK